MITLLKAGYAKILSIFYKNKSADYHLRELSRLTRLHGPSISAALSELVKEKILKTKPIGNLKRHSIIKNNRTYLIFTLFDLERWNKLPDPRKRAVNYYLHSLPEQPIFVILFGSTAKETYKPGSDIDLLIIVNKKISAAAAEKEAQALAGIKISTFQMTYPQFLQEIRLKEDLVVQSALNSGYPLLNHIYYYEKYYERV